MSYLPWYGRWERCPMCYLSRYKEEPTRNLCRRRLSRSPFYRTNRSISLTLSCPRMSYFTNSRCDTGYIAFCALVWTSTHDRHSRTHTCDESKYRRWSNGTLYSWAYSKKYSDITIVEMTPTCRFYWICRWNYTSRSFSRKIIDVYIDKIDFICLSIIKIYQTTYRIFVYLKLYQVLARREEIC